MLKEGDYCIYRGKEYHIESLGRHRANIYTRNKELADDTFFISGTGSYKKEIQYGEVEEAYEIIPRAIVGKWELPVIWEQEDRYILRTEEIDDAEIIDNGHYKDATELIRIEIENVEGLNLRMPSGNEGGANDHWIPGGYTDGGIAEAVTDLIPNDAEHVKISTIKVKRGGF